MIMIIIDVIFLLKTIFSWIKFGPFPCTFCLVSDKKIFVKKLLVLSLYILISFSYEFHMDNNKLFKNILLLLNSREHK